MVANTTASRKSKGRRLQNKVCEDLRLLGIKYGVDPDAIKTAMMSQAGLDIVLSPEAKKVFKDLFIECKNVEKLNIVGEFQQHTNEYGKAAILVHARNRTTPMVTMTWEHYLTLLEHHTNAWLLCRIHLKDSSIK